MADTPGTTPTGAVDETATPATGTPPETGATPEDGNEAISPDAFRKVQAEAKQYRLKLRETEAKLQAREAKDLTEAEKIERRAKEIEAKEAEIVRLERNAEVREAAVAAGASKPEAIIRLIDEDEEIGRAMTRLKREFPELFFNRGTAGTANGGAHGGGAQPNPSEMMDAFIRGRAGR